MKDARSFVERVRPLIGHRPRGEQLFVAALLENGAGQRYREWAVAAQDESLAAGLRACAEREDAVATAVRKHFAAELAQPKDFGELMAAIQREVSVLFGGLGFEEQTVVQAAAERGGEQLWLDLAGSEGDSALKAVFLECAALEAASAEFLENLRRA